MMSHIINVASGFECHAILQMACIMNVKLMSCYIMNGCHALLWKSCNVWFYYVVL